MVVVDRGFPNQVTLRRHWYYSPCAGCNVAVHLIASFDSLASCLDLHVLNSDANALLMF